MNRVQWDTVPLVLQVSTPFYRSWLYASNEGRAAITYFNKDQQPVVCGFRHQKPTDVLLISDGTVASKAGGVCLRLRVVDVKSSNT